MTTWRRPGPVLLGVLLLAVAGCGPTAAGGDRPARPAALPSPGCAGGGGTGGDGRQHTVTLGTGAQRGTYEITVPRRLRPGHPAALVLLFYGFASDPARFSSLTGLPARGGRAGDIVVVPHTGPGEPQWQLSGRGTDAAFVSAVIGRVERRYCVDRRAVYAAGFSAGAAFTIEYACAHPGTMAAIATVAVEFQLGCTRPLSILAFHGTADPLVPYRNGAVGASLPGVAVRGTELNMSDWARLDHCRAPARRRRIGSEVERQQWSHCAPGTTVILYTVLGGGHTWPGADPTGGVGLTTDQISATDLALSFFASSVAPSGR